MRAANGAGLAAPQVDIPLRIFAVEVGDNPRYPYKPRLGLRVLVNPVVRAASARDVRELRGLPQHPRPARPPAPRTRRSRWPTSIPTATEHVERFGGLSAGTMQHELDHLDGILFPDRVEDPDDALHLGDVPRLPPGGVAREHPAAARPLPGEAT